MSNIQPEFEWEPLTRSKELRWKFKLSSTNPLGEGFVDIVVTRNDAWEVEAIASGSRISQVWDPNSLPRLGEDVPMFAIEAESGVCTLRVLDASLGDTHGEADGTSRQELHVYGTAEIAVGDRADALKSAKRCVIWCLNGTDHRIPFDIWTSRTKQTTFKRTRSEFPDRVVTEPETFSDSLDGISVPPPPFGKSPAVLSRVPALIPIDHDLRPAAIEFVVHDISDVPTRRDVDVYVAALSFALGRRLVPVGLSYYDEGHTERLHVLRSSWAFDVRADPAASSEPPTTISSASIDALVRAFVGRVDEYNLKDAMWSVWMADAMAVENTLPTLASVLEGLMTAWFKSNKSKSQAKYMPDKEWTALAGGAIDLLAKALDGNPSAERMLNKLKYANNLGVNEKYPRFLAEIDLPVGQVEMTAIKHRNRAAHGGTFRSGEYRALINTIAAYRTLVMRVILRLLGWDGEYIDYSSYGHPSRALSDPCGGPEGDGVPAVL